MIELKMSALQERDYHGTHGDLSKQRSGGIDAKSNNGYLDIMRYQELCHTVFQPCIIISICGNHFLLSKSDS